MSGAMLAAMPGAKLAAMPRAMLAAMLLAGATLSLPAAAAAARRDPPPPQAPCLTYAPAAVELIGILGREAFDREPIEDLFVDPLDIEVEGTPPAWATPPPAAASPPVAAPPPVDAAPAAAAPPPAAAVAAAPPAPPLPPAEGSAAVAGEAEAGMAPPPPWPADAIGPPPPPPGPDPSLLRARPVRRPLPKEQVWVLTLPKPICLRVEADDLINKPAKNIRKMQLVVEKSLEPGFRQLAKKRVVVRGQLFHQTTRRHYLPILINVEDLRPPEMVEDTTQLPPPPP